MLASTDRYQVVTKILAKSGAIARDQTDDRYLECVLAGEAQYVVSGAQHFLELGWYQGIQVLGPVAFLTLLKLERKVR